MSLPQAYLVDDDEAIRDALAWLLKSRGIPCTAFDSRRKLSRRLDTRS
jgi:two-component system response regulator DctR